MCAGFRQSVRRKNRGRAMHPELLDRARDINSSAAGFEFRVGATQLVFRKNILDRGTQVDRRIER
jgi:hypothetical protein